MGSIAASGIVGISKFDFKTLAKNNKEGDEKFLVLGNEKGRDNTATSRLVLGVIRKSELPFKGHSVHVIQPMIPSDGDEVNSPYQNAKSVVYSGDTEDNRQVWDLFRNYISVRYSEDNASVQDAFRQVDESSLKGAPLSLRKISQIIQDIEDEEKGYRKLWDLPTIERNEEIAEDQSYLVLQDEDGYLTPVDDGERISRSSSQETVYEEMAEDPVADDHTYANIEEPLYEDMVGLRDRLGSSGSRASYASDSSEYNSTRGADKKKKAKKPMKRRLQSWFKKRVKGNRGKVAPAQMEISSPMNSASGMKTSNSFRALPDIPPEGSDNESTRALNGSIEGDFRAPEAEDDGTYRRLFTSERYLPEDASSMSEDGSSIYDLPRGSDSDSERSMYDNVSDPGHRSSMPAGEGTDATDSEEGIYSEIEPYRQAGAFNDPRANVKENPLWRPKTDEPS